MIGGVRRLLKDNAVFGIEALFYGSHGLLGIAFFYADAGQYAEALGFDEDLAFLTFFGTDLFTKSVIGTKEPFAVPACGEDSLLHGFRSLVGPAFLCCVAQKLAEIAVFFRIFDKHACDEDGFCLVAFIVGTGLEGFSRCVGEAVQVQAVVPVGAADERQAVRSEMLQRIIEGTSQMFHQRSCQFFFIIEGNIFGEERGVSGLSYIGGSCSDEP